MLLLRVMLDLLLLRSNRLTLLSFVVFLDEPFVRLQNLTESVTQPS